MVSQHKSSRDSGSLLSPPRYEVRRVSSLAKLLQEGRLNLSPVFQRNSVWRPNQRWKLLETIFRGYPIPAIFLVERHTKSRRIIYDVIDGKQRLEAIFLFMNNNYSALLTDDSADDNNEIVRHWVSWKEMEKAGDTRCRQLLNYEIPVNLLACDWDYPNLREVFIRINSTGTPLSRGELYNARFLKSNFWRICQTSADKLKNTFRNKRVFSQTGINRQEHIDFFSQLVVAILGGVMDKHKGMELAMEKTPWTASDIRKAVKKATHSIRYLTRTLLPNIAETRFYHVSDFYSLTEVLVKLDERRALQDESSIKRARKALVDLSTEIDSADDIWRRGGSLTRDVDIRDYIKSVRANSDGKREREDRRRILWNLLYDLFPRKDSARSFSSGQKRVGYALSDKRCSNPKCRRRLTLAEMQADHIVPWSKGGQTALSNVAPLCAKCNAQKGNR